MSVAYPNKRDHVHRYEKCI